MATGLLRGGVVGSARFENPRLPPLTPILPNTGLGVFSDEDDLPLPQYRVFLLCVVDVDEVAEEDEETEVVVGDEDEDKEREGEGEEERGEEERLPLSYVRRLNDKSGVGRGVADVRPGVERRLPPRPE